MSHAGHVERHDDGPMSIGIGIDTPRLLTRAALVADGMTDTELRRRRAAGGDLVTLARGVLIARSDWDAANEVQQHWLRALAVSSLQGPGTVISHGSAAAGHGLGTLRSARRSVHLTRAGASSTRKRDGHTLHGGRLDLDEVVSTRGIEITTRGRTVADIARSDGWLSGLVVADQALRAGMPRDELVEALARQRGLPGTAAFERLASRADAGSENPGETLARTVVIEAAQSLGLPLPETQFRVDGERTAYADLRLGRVLIEFDGRWKYARDRPFGGGQPPEEVLWREKLREDWLREKGFVVIRLTWSDVWGPGRAAAAARIRAALIAHSGLL